MWLARPAPLHETVTRVSPGWTRRGIVHVHDARPPAAGTGLRPFCFAPLLYRTEIEQRAPAGDTLTATVAGLPCTTRDGPATKPTACVLLFAAPANTATTTRVAKARGIRRFVALAVICPRAACRGASSYFAS